MLLFNANNFSDHMLDIILREHSLGKKIFFKYINGDVKYFSYYINDNCLKAINKYRLYSLDLEEGFIVTLSVGDQILFPNNYTICSDCSNGKHMPTPNPSPISPTPPPYPCDPKKTRRCRKGCETKDKKCEYAGYLGDYCWWGDPKGGQCLDYAGLVCASNNVIVPEDDYITVGTCQTGFPTPAPPPPTPYVCSGLKCNHNSGCPGVNCQCRKPTQSCWPDPPKYGHCCLTDTDPKYKYNIFQCLDISKNTGVGVCKAIPNIPGKPGLGDTCKIDDPAPVCNNSWLECCRGTGTCVVIGSMDPGSC